MKQHRIILKKLLIWLMVLGMSIGAIAPAQTAFADTRTGIVTTSSSSLKLRESAPSGKEVAYMPKGSQVTILGEVDVNGTAWYQINYNGIIGYASSAYITLVESNPGAEDSSGTGDNSGAEEPAYDEWTGRVTASSLNMRSGPGTSYKPQGSGLSKDDLVTVLGEETASDGVLWYKIKFEGLVAYCSSKYIERVEEAAPGEDAEFEAYLDEQGFPESYKKKLRTLHAKYPNWIFVAQYPELDWNTVVYEQYKFGDMLPSNWYGTRAVSILWRYNTPASWKSTDVGAFDWTSCTWKNDWDGSAWVIPSKELVAYYLDPRNFLDSNTVFQFLDMSFDESVQTVEGVRTMANASTRSKWLAGTTTDQDGTTLDYSEAIYNAGKTHGISPYVLLSIINQEVSETHGSVSGTYSGYEGFFNFYNIGAYVDRANGFNTAIARGLWYAGGGKDGAGTSLGRPWNTRQKAIAGGAQHFAVNYVQKNQETLYLKRFDVFDGGNGLYDHQFSTDIQGPNSEAQKLSSMYTEELRKGALVFKIPVYKNMPEKACAQPTGDQCPNYKLESITVGTAALSPEFDMDTTTYTVNVGIASSVSVEAKAYCADAKVTGTGNHSLEIGNNTVKITCTAENGDSRTYTLNLVRTQEENCPSVGFTDLDSEAWYHADVDYVVANGLMKGVSATSFAPDVTTSRAMIVTILHRMSGEEVTKEMRKAVKFTDVASDAYYADPVAWAASKGIVKGVSETKFAPDDPITREQFVTMLYRYAGYKGNDISASGKISSFPDAGSVSEYAKEPMKWAYGNGLINGTTQNSKVILNPAGSAIRVQAAAFIHRFCEWAAEAKASAEAVALEDEETTEITETVGTEAAPVTLTAVEDAETPESEETAETVESEEVEVLEETEESADTAEREDPPESLE